MAVNVLSVFSLLLRGLWLGVCILALIWFLPVTEPEAGVAFAIFMALLSFPFSIMVMVLFAVAAGLASAFGITFPAESFMNYVYWGLCVAVGYYQWFIFLPRLWRRSRRPSNKALQSDVPRPAGAGRG
jgi:hypothetical protein